MSTTITPTGASILGFLLEKPLTGWDINKKAQTAIGAFWSLTSSQVYAELQQLHKKSYTVVHDRGKRGRVTYAITADGKKAFAQWTMQTPAEEQIRFPLVLMISFGQHLPKKQLRLYIETHKTIHKARLHQYRSLLDEVRDPFQKTTLDLGIKYEQSLLAWIDDVAILLKETH